MARLARRVDPESIPRRARPALPSRPDGAPAPVARLRRLRPTLPALAGDALLAPLDGRRQDGGLRRRLSAAWKGFLDAKAAEDSHLLGAHRKPGRLRPPPRAPSSTPGSRRGRRRNADSIHRLPGEPVLRRAGRLHLLPEPRADAPRPRGARHRRPALPGGRRRRAHPQAEDLPRLGLHGGHRRVPLPHQPAALLPSRQHLRDGVDAAVAWLAAVHVQHARLLQAARAGAGAALRPRPRQPDAELRHPAHEGEGPARRGQHPPPADHRPAQPPAPGEGHPPQGAGVPLVPLGDAGLHGASSGPHHHLLRQLRRDDPERAPPRRPASCRSSTTAPTRTSSVRSRTWRRSRTASSSSATPRTATRARAISWRRCTRCDIVCPSSRRSSTTGRRRI